MSARPSSSRSPESALDEHLKRLLEAWRRRTGAAGPAGRLTGADAAAVSHALQGLSQGLTRERRLAGRDYFSDPASWGAYLLYFWPVSYLQARHLLRRLAARPRRVLDLGSGAGPLGTAALDEGAREIWFADRSREALRIAERLSPRAGARIGTLPWDPDQRPLPVTGTFDWIGLQHVVNELWTGAKDRLDRLEALLHTLLDRLTPGGRLVVLEPALTPTSRALLTLRDRLLARGRGVVYPCLGPAPCPALMRAGDSCHLEDDWTPPALVRDLIRRAGWKKKSLKYAALVLATGPQPPGPGDRFRILSEPLRSKNGRIRLIACGPAGRLGLALHPDAATPANRIFFHLRRGEVVEIHGALPSGSGLSLGPEASVRRLVS